ncbi:MAG: hypothetical protein HYX61_04360 [Gammaproteobacteria bacterium]|jgi:hypothetical protein|nr:hypothetical protein [Gammaproteobacteria bacterium]
MSPPKTSEPSKTAKKSHIPSMKGNIEKYVESLKTSVNLWQAEPKEFYLAMKEIQDEHIYRGFNPKKFWFPVAKPALDHIKDYFKANSFKELGVPELQNELEPLIKKNLEHIKRLEKGVDQEIIDPITKEPIVRTVPYPYDECVEASLQFLEIVDYIFRVKAYKELNKDLKNPELQRILDSQDSVQNKVVALSKWDFARTEKDLTDKMDKKPSIVQIVQGMRLPPYFQSTNYTNLIRADLLDPDTFDASFIVPSFLPLDISFLNDTRPFAVYPMGMLDMEHLFADAFKHTPIEFAYHDLKHAWDMQLFNYVALHNTELSPSELADQMKEIYDHITQKQKELKTKDPDLYETVELLLFELLHEEGHALEIGDMREGLDEKSMYGNYFLDRLNYKIGPFNFFGDPERKRFAELSPRYKEGVDLLKQWFNSAEKDLKIDVRKENRLTSTEHKPEKTGIKIGPTVSQFTKGAKDSRGQHLGIEIAKQKKNDSIPQTQQDYNIQTASARRARAITEARDYAASGMEKALNKTRKESEKQVMKTLKEAGVLPQNDEATKEQEKGPSLEQSTRRLPPTKSK